MNVGKLLEELQTKRGVRASFLRFLLSVGASFYNLVTSFRCVAFANGWIVSRRLPVPVLALGNITTGGTGKTPAAIWCIRKLRECSQLKPVLLSRGYGADEKKLFEESLPDTPHFVHRQRVAAGLQALKHCGKNICLVLDDAFQHRYLRRDLNIVLVDATAPFGFDAPLPRGFLRESLSNLRLADFVILTRSDMVESKTLSNIQTRLRSFTLAPQAKAIHAPRGVRKLRETTCRPLETLQGQKLFAFSGIGNPESFFQNLQKLGYELVGKAVYPDHHAYSDREQKELSEKASACGAQAFITTAKDAVKLASWSSLPLPLWILEIEFRLIEGEETLLQKIKERMLLR